MKTFKSNKLDNTEYTYVPSWEQEKATKQAKKQSRLHRQQRHVKRNTNWEL